MKKVVGCIRAPKPYGKIYYTECYLCNHHIRGTCNNSEPHINVLDKKKYYEDR